MKEKPLTFARAGLRIRVYSNRVEIRDGSIFFNRTYVIPYSNIARVGIGKWLKRLEIYTNDGKVYKYAFFFASKTRKCCNAIVSRM